VIVRARDDGKIIVPRNATYQATVPLHLVERARGRIGYFDGLRSRYPAIERKPRGDRKQRDHPCRVPRPRCGAAR
jgi:hypothetical protein